MKLFPSLAAVALLAVTLPAAAQDPTPAPKKDSGGQCFFTRSIWNYQASDDERTLYLRVNNRDVYRLDFGNTCVGISYKQRIAIKSISAGAICQPIDIDIRVRDNGITTPCFVSGLHKLTPEEIAALPKKLVP